MYTSSVLRPAIFQILMQTGVIGFIPIEAAEPPPSERTDGIKRAKTVARAVTAPLASG